MIGNFYLVNIGGVMLKNLLTNVSIQHGKNVFELNLSGVSVGMYMVMLKTNKGFKTQRVIVE